MALHSFLMASFYDAVLGKLEAACLGAWRAELLGHALGDVLEIGAGTGANLPYYPARLRSLTLAEPDPHMRSRLQRKLRSSPFSGCLITTAAVDDLDLPAGSFDCIVSTLVLCSVNSQASALEKLNNLLKPGGQLLFIEHVGAVNQPGLYRWQHILQPLWRPLCGNCHLTRDTECAIRSAGFSIRSIQHLNLVGAPAFVAPAILGVATKTDKL